MFGIINNSEQTLYGKVYLNEIRLTGVKKEPGSAYMVDGNFVFGDLFEIGATYSEKEADYHMLEQRIGSGNHVKDLKLTFKTNTHELFKRHFFTNPISMTYDKTISAPKYKSGSDIFFGDIDSTPEDQRTYLWT
mgnify:CR=1 FL=1